MSATKFNKECQLIVDPYHVSDFEGYQGLPPEAIQDRLFYLASKCLSCTGVEVADVRQVEQGARQEQVPFVSDGVECKYAVERAALMAVLES